MKLTAITAITVSALVLFTAPSFADEANSASAEASKVRVQSAQNGGEAVQAKPQYAAGLNGRVVQTTAAAESTPAEAPKVRVHAAQNGGASVQAQPQYAAGLNGRETPAPSSNAVASLPVQSTTIAKN